MMAAQEEEKKNKIKKCELMLSGAKYFCKCDSLVKSEKSPF